MLSLPRIMDSRLLRPDNDSKPASVTLVPEIANPPRLAKSLRWAMPASEMAPKSLRFRSNGLFRLLQLRTQFGQVAVLGTGTSKANVKHRPFGIAAIHFHIAMHLLH